MNFDQYGLIVQDPPSNDGGDTCNRMGQYYTALTASVNRKKWPNSSEGYCLFAYVSLLDQNLNLKRHHDQVPWNNPRNCSRDQMLPMFTALAVNGMKHDLWTQAKKMIGRLGFYQNIERDYQGSKKRPWPHHYIDDAGRSAFSYFDFADPSQPSDYAVFLRGLFHDSLFWFLAYPFILIGDLWNALSILEHLKSREYKEPCHVLCFYVQSRKQIPTFVSRYLCRQIERYAFRLHKDLDWYFGGRGGYDSPKFAQLWGEVLDGF